jgi:hypothetical protein
VAKKKKMGKISSYDVKKMYLGGKGGKEELKPLKGKAHGKANPQTSGHVRPFKMKETEGKKSKD